MEVFIPPSQEGHGWHRLQDRKGGDEKSRENEADHNSSNNYEALAEHGLEDALFINAGIAGYEGQTSAMKRAQRPLCYHEFSHSHSIAQLGHPSKMRESSLHIEIPKATR